MGKDVIIACDFASREATLAFLDQFTGKKPFIKIGMELYYAEGPQITSTSTLLASPWSICPMDTHVSLNPRGPHPDGKSSDRLFALS